MSTQVGAWSSERSGTRACGANPEAPEAPNAVVPKEQLEIDASRLASEAAPSNQHSAVSDGKHPYHLVFTRTRLLAKFHYAAVSSSHQVIIDSALPDKDAPELGRLLQPAFLLWQSGFVVVGKSGLVPVCLPNATI